MNVASYIDHTILKATTTNADVEKICNEAREYRFAAVCVPPSFVKSAKKNLIGSQVKLAAVIGFPFGYSTAKAKFCEVEQAIEDGADELDIVINVGHVKDGDWKALEQEAKMLIPPVHLNNGIVKIIIESGVLTNDEIIKCCRLYGELGADYVKTSTGYAETGATIEAVQLMRANLPSGIKIKASGGIRSLEALLQYIEAGADRIGTSSGVAIMKQQMSSQ
jgi:deoxyribose-phosphate aldolase